MTGQLDILSGHCLLTGRYLRPACVTTQPEMRIHKCKTVDILHLLQQAGIIHDAFMTCNTLKSVI